MVKVYPTFASFVKSSTTFVIPVVFIIIGFFFLSQNEARAQAIGGIGWINFSCETTDSCDSVDYAVEFDENTGWLTGYAWANPQDPNSTDPNDGSPSPTNTFGWIQFGGLSGFPSGPGTISQNARVDLAGGTPSARPVIGWARVTTGDDASGWDGWISLWGDGYGVQYDSVQETFYGFAWGGPTVGWINFNPDPDFGGVTISCGVPFDFSLSADTAQVLIGTAINHPIQRNLLDGTPEDVILTEVCVVDNGGNCITSPGTVVDYTILGLTTVTLTIPSDNDTCGSLGMPCSTPLNISAQPEEARAPSRLAFLSQKFLSEPDKTFLTFFQKIFGEPVIGAGSRIDLIITSFDMPGGSPNETVNASVTIQNIGTQGTTFGFNVGVNPNSTSIDCLTGGVYSIFTPAIGIGESRVVSVPVTLPSSEGLYGAGAMVDSGCSIGELSEANNTASDPYAVLPAPPTSFDVKVTGAPVSNLSDEREVIFSVIPLTEGPSGAYCGPTPDWQLVGQPVTWQVTDLPPGAIGYSWLGGPGESDNLINCAINNACLKVYTTVGDKDGFIIPLDDMDMPIGGPIPCDPPAVIGVFPIFQQF